MRGNQITAPPGKRPRPGARTPRSRLVPAADAERRQRHPAHQSLPGAEPLQHRVARAGHLEPAQPSGRGVRGQRVVERAGGAGDPVACAVGDDDGATGQLLGGLAVGQPRRQRRHRPHLPGACRPQHRPTAHRVPDQADGHLAVPVGDLRQRPLHVVHRVAVVVAAPAVAQLAGGKAGARDRPGAGRAGTDTCAAPASATASPRRCCGCDHRARAERRRAPGRAEQAS